MYISARAPVGTSRLLAGRRWKRLSVGRYKGCGPVGLGLTRHGPFHAVGQLDVLELDEGHHHTPVLGGDVENLPDAYVDAIGLGQRLVEGVLADDLAQGGLGDLVDGSADALDRHDRL